MAQLGPRIGNIGPGEQRKRALLGYGLLALSLALTGLFYSFARPAWWSLALFLPLWGSMLGLLQARYKT
ncbi:MAG: hypothetical protein AB7N91_08285 [Candidatus Tectimicrobiota bacterium]